MALEGALDGLFVGADHQVVYRDASSPLQDMTGWTVQLDFRRTDTATQILLAKVGTVSGTYDADANDNTQVVTFVLTDDDLAAATFKGDDPVVRYSIKRTDSGAEQILRYGDATIIRATQA